MGAILTTNSKDVELIASIYNTSLDPESWPEVLLRLAHRLGAAGSFIFEEMIKVPVEVRDIMTPIVFSVEEDAPVTEIAEIMMDEHLHRIFVIHAGEVTGIITTFDLLKIIADAQ